MSKFKIYHNPRCTSSRLSLALLTDAGLEPEVIIYLDNPPTREELVKIASCLNMKPIEFTRVNEPLFMMREFSTDMSDGEVFDVLAQHPILIQRPIIVKDDSEAVVGRPPENVNALL